MPNRPCGIPKLFTCPFTVDLSAPFRRHLNRLEVEIGREDYRHLKRVELLRELPGEAVFAAMEEITGRLLDHTQNNYNRELLQRLGIRVYLDQTYYAVYYRLADRALRFIAKWRGQVLHQFFGRIPLKDCGWRPCGSALPGFAARFLPDSAGGVVLLRRQVAPSQPQPLLTATHGPYDPHTLDVALYLLRSGAAGSAIINLGFSGREPLTDDNLEKLKSWGIPLNPSNIDVIYPYVDAQGHPLCYKLEEGLHRFVALLELPAPQLLLDIHGCVGATEQDACLVVGLGGFPPYPRLQDLGQLTTTPEGLQLRPAPLLQQGLSLLQQLSPQLAIELCSAPHLGQLFLLQEPGLLLGRAFDPRSAVRSLLPGEERTFVPDVNVRWLPGAGGNALQRLEARKLNPEALCLQVEIPTPVRRRIALKLRELAIGESLTASCL